VRSDRRRFAASTYAAPPTPIRARFGPTSRFADPVPRLEVGGAPVILEGPVVAHRDTDEPRGASDGQAEPLAIVAVRKERRPSVGEGRARRITVGPRPPSPEVAMLPLGGSGG
jgi:hypothetical protein